MEEKNKDKNQCKKMIIFSSLDEKNNIDLIVKSLSDILHISESKIIEKALISYLMTENEFIQDIIINLYKDYNLSVNKCMNSLYEYIYKQTEIINYKDLLNCHIEMLNDDFIIYDDFYTQYVLNNVKDILEYLKDKSKKSYSAKDYDTPINQLTILYDFVFAKKEFPIKELYLFLYTYYDYLQTQKNVIYLLSILSKMSNNLYFEEKEKYKLQNILLKMF